MQHLFSQLYIRLRTYYIEIKSEFIISVHFAFTNAQKGNGYLLVTIYMKKTNS